MLASIHNGRLKPLVGRMTEMSEGAPDDHIKVIKILIFKEKIVFNYKLSNTIESR